MMVFGRWRLLVAEETVVVAEEIGSGKGREILESLDTCQLFIGSPYLNLE